VRAVPIRVRLARSRQRSACRSRGCTARTNRATRLYIVDDDESVADSLKSLLETFGFEVRCYTSGADFLVDYTRRSAGCLVIDHHMPGLNGLDVVDQLQKHGLRVPTILISGRLDTNIRKRAASLGVTSVIEKPFAAHQLVDLIRTAFLERN
jgi:two-component system, LuxR family, response regulator FixJ